MDHAEAIEKQAAERYLLGELPASEAEDFERHFFECSDCAEAVDFGGWFVEGARTALRQPLPAESQWVVERRATPAKFRWWPQAVLACAAAVLAAVVVYQSAVVIPGLKQVWGSAQVLPAFQLAGASRGEAAPLRVSREVPFVSLAADIPPDATYPKYACTLTSGSRTIFRVIANAPAPGQPITVLVPVNTLSPGAYELTIYGGNDSQNVRIASYPFQLEFQ
jgi:hypothetical protein